MSGKSAKEIFDLLLLLLLLFIIIIITIYYYLLLLFELTRKLDDSTHFGCVR